MEFQYYLPTRILFGEGSLKKLAQQAMPGKKALIVITSGKSVRVNGYLDTLQQQLSEAGAQYAIFDGISPNPDKDEVMNGAQTARAEGCDFVVALGGGSVIDGAKAIALAAANPGDLWDYMLSGSGKQQAPKGGALPLIAITTTAGTGSEADAIAVITNGDEKLGFNYPCLFPVLSIVDPEIMKTVPPKLTAYQGFDALFHCAEAYLSLGGNEMTDNLALGGVRNISQYLLRAVENGNDIEARGKVALGSTLGGFVLALAAMTSQHAMEHSMSALHHELPHGAGLIMISQAYFGHWAKHFTDPEVERRFLELAKAMGVEAPKDAMSFVTALAQLEQQCGVGELKMSDYGITQEELPEMVRLAKTNMYYAFPNDRVQLSDADCLSIYQNSFR